MQNPSRPLGLLSHSGQEGCVAGEGGEGQGAAGETAPRAQAAAGGAAAQSRAAPSSPGGAAAAEAREKQGACALTSDWRCAGLHACMWAHLYPGSVCGHIRGHVMGYLKKTIGSLWVQHLRICATADMFGSVHARWAPVTVCCQYKYLCVCRVCVYMCVCVRTKSVLCECAELHDVGEP